MCAHSGIEMKCPKCDKEIDPNDESNISYTVLEGIINEHNELTRVIVQCNVCRDENISIAIGEGK